MCYTGKCKYEISGGDYVGACNLYCKTEDFPDDAYCVKQELLIEEDNLLKNYYKQINQNKEEDEYNPFSFLNEEGNDE